MIMPFSPASLERANIWFRQKGIKPPPDFMDKSELYNDLVRTWSARMNIVARKDLNDLLEKHILDSIEPLEAIPESGNLVDIGSGGGFPAIPLALVRPELRLTLLESKHKKILFLKEAERHLGLRNISIVESRLEDFFPELEFDIATIRALPGWEGYIEKIKSLLSAEGKIIYYEKRGIWRLIEKS